jgi:PAS domain S-box-containing protein
MQPEAIAMMEPERLQSEHLNFAGSLMDCIAQGIIVIGPARQILAFNEPAEKLTGLHAPDLLNRTIAVLPPSLQAVIDETFVTGRHVIHRDVLLARGAGADVLLQVSTNIAHHAGGGVLSVLAELQNVSQARSMAANLEHLDRLASLGVLSAGVAHEIKNALVAVRTFVDLPADQRDKELTELVSQELRRIDAIVRQMLRGATREDFKLAPLSMHTLLRDSVNLLRHELQARHVKLELELSAKAERVNGDERQLRHAILNLLINALEAINGSGGRITVSTEAIELWQRPHLCTSISDTGTGISSENLARLFSPFFTTKKEGTGLGLAITRRIIQEHNGAITVKSKVNEGTTFHVFLPLLEVK